MMPGKSVMILSVFLSRINLSKEKHFGSDGATLILGLTAKQKQALILRFSPKKQENAIQ